MKSINLEENDTSYFTDKNLLVRTCLKTLSQIEKSFPHPITALALSQEQKIFVGDNKGRISIVDNESLESLDEFFLFNKVRHLLSIRLSNVLSTNTEDFLLANDLGSAVIKVFSLRKPLALALVLTGVYAKSVECVCLVENLPNSLVSVGDANKLVLWKLTLDKELSIETKQEQVLEHEPTSLKASFQYGNIVVETNVQKVVLGLCCKEVVPSSGQVGEEN